MTLMVMDVTDLADLDVYSELTTEGSSRLSTVEDTAMQLRGLAQSMKSSVPPVPHADDMLMYSHLSSSCTTSWSESCRVLAVLLVKSTPQRKLLPVMTHTLQGDVCCPGLDLCNFPKLRRTPMPCKLATCCIGIKIAANIKFMT